MDKDVLKKSSLCEAFKGVMEKEQLGDVFSRAFITNLCYHKNDKKIEMDIECHSAVKPNHLEQLERALTTYFSVKAHIRPGFKHALKEQLDNWHEELLMDWVSRKKEHIVHFLEGARFSLSGRHLKVNLANQSSAILTSAGGGRCLEEAMQVLFDREVKVSFVDLELTGEPVDYIMEKQEAEARLVAEVMANLPEIDPQRSQSSQNAAPKAQKPASSDNGFVRYKSSGKAAAKEREQNPNIIFGRTIKGQPVKMNQVDTNSGAVVIEGQILKSDKRELKNGRTLVTFDITDFSSSLTCKLFPNEDELSLILEK
ncbi:MAG: hypothetical protein N2376_05660, partial [Clostridia bacterium]|nr:hypothetical protein [Clostridia bacterium]